MALKNAVPASETAEKAEIKYSKEQLLASERFRDRKDIVNALLSSDKEYTVSAVKNMIENYMKGKVR